MSNITSSDWNSFDKNTTMGDYLVVTEAALLLIYLIVRESLMIKIRNQATPTSV